MYWQEQDTALASTSITMQAITYQWNLSDLDSDGYTFQLQLTKEETKTLTLTYSEMAESGDQESGLDIFTCSKIALP